MYVNSSYILYFECHAMDILVWVCCHAPLTSHPDPLHLFIWQRGQSVLRHVMDNIWLFVISTERNVDKNTPPPFPFSTVSSVFLLPFLRLSKPSIIPYHMSLNGLLREGHSRCYKYPLGMLFFRKKLNWSVTVCTMTFVIHPPMAIWDSVFLRHVFMHSFVDLDTLGQTFDM